MSEKGTLCHAATRSETCEGVSPPKWADMGGGRGGEEGESLWCVLGWKYCVSLCKLKFMFPCATVIPIQGSP